MRLRAWMWPIMMYEPMRTARPKKTDHLMITPVCKTISYGGSSTRLIRPPGRLLMVCTLDSQNGTSNPFSSTKPTGTLLLLLLVTCRGVTSDESTCIEITTMMEVWTLVVVLIVRLLNTATVK
jgi:hypothetical protein